MHRPTMPPVTNILKLTKPKDSTETITTYPGKPVELGLITRGQLTVHRRQSGLLFRKLFVKVTCIGTAILKIIAVSMTRPQNYQRHTIVGKYGGGIRLFITSSKLTSLKKACCLTSSASVLPAPSRRCGSRFNNYIIICL